PADCGHVNPHDDVAVVGDFRLRYFGEGRLPRPVIDHGSHCWPSSPRRSADPRLRGRLVPDSPASNPGRGNPDDVLGLPAGPRLNAGRKGVGLLARIIEMMRRPLNQDTPAFARFGVEVIDLECDAVFGMLDARAQILISRAGLSRPE